MIREFIGTRTIASAFMPKKRRKMRTIVPGVSAVGMLAGAGIAYMALKKNRKHEEE